MHKKIARSTWLYLKCILIDGIVSTAKLHDFLLWHLRHALRRALGKGRR